MWHALSATVDLLNMKSAVYKLSYKALKQLSINGSTSSKVDFCHRPPQTPSHEFQVTGITLNTEYYTWVKILRVEVRIPETLPHSHTYSTPPPPAIYIYTCPVNYPVTLKRRNSLSGILQRKAFHSETEPLLRWVRKRDGGKVFSAIWNSLWSQTATSPL